MAGFPYKQLRSILRNNLYRGWFVTSFVDTHPLRAAFVGNRLMRLVDQIIAQGDDLIATAGLSFRASACSTVLLLSESPGQTIADIGRRLEQPHQLVAQRVGVLIKLGLVVRTADSSDARRKILTLTAMGQSQAAILMRVLKDSAAAFNQLEQQLGFDIVACADRVRAALNEEPLAERTRHANAGDQS